MEKYYINLLLFCSPPPNVQVILWDMTLKREKKNQYHLRRVLTGHSVRLSFFLSSFSFSFFLSFFSCLFSLFLLFNHPYLFSFYFKFSFHQKWPLSIPFLNIILFIFFCIHRRASGVYRFRRRRTSLSLEATTLPYGYG